MSHESRQVPSWLIFDVGRRSMILVFPVLSVLVVVLTCSFVLRQGLTAYREKKAISVFALGVSLVVYFVAVLGARIGGLEFIGTGLTRSSDLERWVLARQAITTVHSLLPLWFIIYLVVLVRRDLGDDAVHRSRFKETLSLSTVAFLFAALGLFRHI